MALTHTQINKLIPSDKCKPNRPDKYSHADDLQLWVRNTGNKVWYSAYRLNGKQQTLQLGKYPALSLQQAIKRNLEVKQQVDDGIDPKTKKRDEKAKNENINIFDCVAEEYYQYRKGEIQESTIKRDYSQYQRDIKPALGKYDMNMIEPPQILAMAKAIEARGATDMARRAIGQVKQIYDYGVLNGHARYNPAIGLQKGLRKHKVKHHARIKAKQLPELFSDINNYGGHLIVKLGFWFMAYVFLRTKEMRFIEWCDIDFKNKILHMPADKMKMDRAHDVPLAPQVIDLLNRIKDMGLSDKYVFYNIMTKKPYSSNAWTNALGNMGWRGEMTGHGFRGTATTALNNMGYDDNFVQAELAHVVGNTVARAYNHADYMKQRTKMMNDWANYVTDLINGDLDNIIQMPKPKHQQQS